jgi:hypothetical protein
MDASSKSAKHPKQVLKNNPPCDSFLEKHSFFMERPAAALYLDLGLHIRNALTSPQVALGRHIQGRSTSTGPGLTQRARCGTHLHRTAVHPIPKTGVHITRLGLLHRCTGIPQHISCGRHINQGPQGTFRFPVTFDFLSNALTDRS